jgi:hypothetical protein
MTRNKFSLIACILVGLVMLVHRVGYSELAGGKALKVTTWDAFGYYMYLPSTIIYGDVKKLEWLPAIEEEYDLTGGYLYQSNKCDNGNYVNKYLGGVSIMQLPFFLVAHLAALNSNHNADGFSRPYQYAMAYGGLIYSILALFLLRFLLLKYFRDLTVALSIALLVLATNMIQYTSIDSAMSHVYIFPLYVLILYLTIKWHDKPHWKWAAGIGFVIGLATISRPTEAIMFLIPLLWNLQNKEESKKKWALVRSHWKQIFVLVAFGLLAISPQLIYWKYVSGDWVFNVGSKWVFLNPFFRVLFGWNTGWFIYTPITILFILGLFFVKNYPFRKSVIVFCLLNIWVVIAWWDWRYGATYSTRALVQSYPIFIFPFAAIIERITETKLKYLLYVAGVYLSGVNLFQIYQYNNYILHYRDMNRAYYSRIYLNGYPTTIDMSLLDSPNFIKDISDYDEIYLWRTEDPVRLHGEKSMLYADVEIPVGDCNQPWLRVNTNISVDSVFHPSIIKYVVIGERETRSGQYRIFNPLTRPNQANDYAFYVPLPEDDRSIRIELYVESEGLIRCFAESSSIILLSKK